MKAGQAVFLPRGVPHQSMNVNGRPSYYMLICTPSGFEGFLAEGGHLRQPGEEVKPPTAKDINRLKAAAPDDKRHGTTTLFAALDVATGRVIAEPGQFTNSSRLTQRYVSSI